MLVLARSLMRESVSFSKNLSGVRQKVLRPLWPSYVYFCLCEMKSGVECLERIPVGFFSVQ